jgi:hypothetical protein
MPKVPLLKNCRVDNKYVAGSNWAILVDYIQNVCLLIKPGTHTIGEMHKELKFMVKNKLPIDNYPYIALPHEFYKIEGAIYQY